MSNNPKYRVSLKVGLKKVTKTAKSIVEALRALPSDHLYRAKAVITVETGSKKAKTYKRAEVFLYPVQSRKLVINKSLRSYSKSE